ncbi:hypothetical protein VP1G_07520 [Cytospora mali]|uniref:Heterokaryon incompatibility domain-containing protein n=1 Tax=Cytospora mali TaxID=578113 RepID=A0A194V8U3_CYTMA|nr:hypothetical protein VP1G_07520 [Valsa mali var. pyri (nom. inval.)]
MTGGIPCCRNCFALALEDETCSVRTTSYIRPDRDPRPPPSHLAERNWPPQVQFLYQNGRPTSQAAPYRGPEKRLSQDDVQSPALIPSPGQHKGHALRLSAKEATQQARVLVLEGGDLAAPLHGQLRELWLYEDQPYTPNYEYLSYTRPDAAGDIDRSEALYLGDYWDIVYVTKDCASALRHVRNADAPRTLWVDAVCLSQQEEPQQIPIIARVCSNADRVVAYLGDASDTSRNALSWLDHQAHGHTSTMPSAVRKRKRDGQGQEGRSEIAAAVRRLFERPYFSPIRVVLELTVAQSVLLQCGWDTALWPLAGLTGDGDGDGAPRWLSYRQRRAAICEEDLLPLLTCTRHNRCADPRDRIFCIVGMIRRWNGAAIPPCCDLSVREVFTGIAAYLATRHAALGSVLSLAAAGTDRPRDTGMLLLPTWVPDWGNLPTPGTAQHATPEVCLDTAGHISSARARWTLYSGEEKIPEVYSDSGFLRVPAMLLSPPSRPALSISERSGATILALHRDWDDNRFSISWPLPAANTHLSEDDELVWLAGQLAVVRPDEHRAGHYSVVLALGGDFTLAVPPSLAGLDDLEEGTEDMDNETYERLTGSMFTTDGEGSYPTPQIRRRIGPMSTERQARVMMLASGLTTEEDVVIDHSAIEGSTIGGADGGDVQEGFRKARDRLLDLALYSRAGLFRAERALWEELVRACTDLRLHDALGARLLAARPADLGLGGGELGGPAQVMAWARDWSLWKMLEQADLGTALPRFAPLVSALIRWLRSVEGLFRWQSTKGQVLSTIWDGDFPGSDMPSRWLQNWQAYIEHGTSHMSTTYDPASMKQVVVAVLQHATRLVKVANARLPDLDRTGLGELDETMRRRAAIAERISAMEWVHCAFWAADIQHLSDFDQDMVLRMELRALGLEGDREEVIIVT